MPNDPILSSEQLKAFVAALYQKPWSYRLKIKDKHLTIEWSKWLIHPTPSYLETEKQGPHRLADIERIDIDPIKRVKMGRQIPEKEVDHSEDINGLLHSLDIYYSKEGKYFLIPVKQGIL